jgi:deoxyadenosine/deoxycytidine kinase
MNSPFSPETKRIEICGGIASGKTTLAKLLGFAKIHVVTEDFSSNPFWQAFYVDPINTAFETEITFLLQHYHQIKIATHVELTFVCDFSLLLDSAYANITLNGSRLETFQRVCLEASSHIRPPDLLIFLQCPPEVEFERIQRRGREAEKSITIDYLASINDRLTSIVSALPVDQEVLVIDSGSHDFVQNEETKESIVRQIMDKISSIGWAS